MEIENIIESRRERIRKLRESPEGKFKVIGLDKFSDEDWLQGEYNSAEEALSTARKMTRDSMKYASSGDIATVYYAYSPDGEYLGGDVWNEE